MFLNLTFRDIVYAAVAALVLTHLILRLGRVKQVMRHSVEVPVQPQGKELEMILEGCRRMFPISVVDFQGKSFETGAMVRIVTRQKKIIVGKLIGKNSMEILCILTNSQVIAHEINKIADMVALEEQEEQ